MKKLFKYTFKPCNNVADNFFLFLRKGVYPYGYIDEWEKLNDISLPEKGDFYSNLNMENFTDSNYKHAKRVCKDFEIKYLREYHNLYFKSDALLLVELIF